jgi:hypothetical protein
MLGGGDLVFKSCNAVVAGVSSGPWSCLLQDAIS